MKWHHDCEHCLSLGDVYLGGQRFDLYFCRQGALHLSTVVARYGDECSSYFSGLSSAAFHPALLEAKNRAESRGLL